MSSRFQLESLNKSHDRLLFDCGEESLNRYFQTQATQDCPRRIANCFVAIDSESGNVASYYTLSSASIPTLDLPEDITRRLPRYPSIPAVRIDRLAVDKRYQGHGLGKSLVADAAIKTISATPVSFALIVDAKNEQAVEFYGHHGFRLLSNRLNLFIFTAGDRRKMFDLIGGVI